MDDKEKIKAALTMLKQLKKMVGFFMKKDIAALIELLENPGNQLATEDNITLKEKDANYQQVP